MRAKSLSKGWSFIVDVVDLFSSKTLYTFMRCLTVFALFMWLLVVSRSSDYWLGISLSISDIALVDVKVCLGIPSCGTRWVPRVSRGLILGSTGRGRPILGSTGRGCPLLYPASVFPTFIQLLVCSQKLNKEIFDDYL